MSDSNVGKVTPSTEVELNAELINSLEPKVQRFVHMYMTGNYSKNKIAELLEVHPNTILKWSKRRDVQQVMSDMQEATHVMVSTQLKSLTIKATERLSKLMDSPIDGVALQAVKDVLDRSGHKAKQEVKKEVTVRSFEEKLHDVIDATIDAEFEEVD